MGSADFAFKSVAIRESVRCGTGHPWESAGISSGIALGLHSALMQGRFSVKRAYAEVNLVKS